jgi:hypothetical protein
MLALSSTMFTLIIEVSYLQKYINNNGMNVNSFLSDNVW